MRQGFPCRFSKKAKAMKKNVTLIYGLIMAVFSIGYVAMSSFSSVFLLDAGLTNTSIGLILSIGALASVAFQPAIGGLIDRNPHVTSREVIMLLTAMVVAVGIAILVIPGNDTTRTSILYCAAIFFMMLAQPFLNSMGMETLRKGYVLSFGIGRSIGSLGYAVGSYVFGDISVKAGPRSVPIAFSGAYLVVCLLLWLYPVRGRGANAIMEMADEENVSEMRGHKDNPFLFLLRYKRLAAILMGLVMIYFGHSLINTYALQIVIPKGGDSGDMGTAAAIAAGCELVTTMVFAFYMRKVKLHILLKISCLFFTAKIFLSYLVKGVMAFFLIQGLQMFGWGILWIGIVYYVNDLAGDRDKAQGQAYAGMSFTIASVLGNLLGGRMIDAFCVDVMLLSGTAVSLVGTVVIWVFLKEIRKDESVSKNTTGKIQD